jgi:type IV secretion system protein VirD4
VIIPNLLGACGPVVAASTKTDLILTTSPARSRVGECMLFDPSGRTEVPPGIRRVAWSPLKSCGEWEQALLLTEAMVRAARPAASGRSAEASHWTERAEALISCCMHAASLGEMPLAEVMSRIDRRQITDFRTILAKEDAAIALDTLDGIDKTDSRELSGIWSTAASVLAAYRSPAALLGASGEEIDFESFVESESTLYLCAPSESQAHAAAIVAGLVRDVRSTAYRAGARGKLGYAAGRAPLLLALDELANIAPLHDLPSLVSEGGSQGVVTLACVQDLSQMVGRWGQEGEGFLSLFNAKIVFPGLADRRTLEVISLLGGERQVPTTSHSSGSLSPGTRGLFGRRVGSHETTSYRTTPALPVDVVARGDAGRSVLIIGSEPYLVRQEPWFSDSVLREVLDAGLTRRPLEQSLGIGPARDRRGAIGRGL